MLVSPSSVRLLICAVRCCTLFGAVPYRYNEKTRKFTFDDSKRMRIIWWVHNIIYNGYMLYVTIRWLQQCMISSGSDVAMSTLYVTINYHCSNAVQLSMATSYGQHHKWLNLFFEYVENIESKSRLRIPTAQYIFLDVLFICRIHIAYKYVLTFNMCVILCIFVWGFCRNTRKTFASGWCKETGGLHENPDSILVGHHPHFLFGHLVCIWLSANAILRHFSICGSKISHILANPTVCHFS
jgi:hypothetical protein